MQSKPRYPVTINFQDSSKATVSPELLWHAPEGTEYLVQLKEESDWNFSHNSDTLQTKEEACNLARAMWNAREGKANLRVVRVCRWTGQDEQVVVHSVIRAWKHV